MRGSGGCVCQSGVMLVSRISARVAGRKQGSREWGTNTDLCYPRPEVAPDKELVPLQLGLKHDEGEVRPRVHIACHLFHLFDLFFYAVVYPV